MKIPFFSSLFDRKARAQEAASAALPKTGGQLIRSARVEPHHAQVLREVSDCNRKMLRMYEAAITTNLNADFKLTTGSANAEILVSLYLARGRSRTLAQDDATFKGILRTVRNNVCGDDPFRLQMNVGKWSADGKKFTPETETNRKIQDAWALAGRQKNCTVRRDMSRLELYHCVIASMKRDGSIIGRHHRGFKNNKFRYAIELVESDRLQESYMGRSPQGNDIRFSIERDKFNAPVAYWLLTRHPGEVFGYNGGVPNTWRERVDAEDIIHFNNIRDRAEQDIGFPEYDSIITHLHHSRQFDRAHVTAAIWAACKPFFLVRKLPTGMQYAGDPSQFIDPAAPGLPGFGPGLPTAGDGKGRGADKIKAVEPGTGEILDHGLEPMLVDPKFPVEAATGFRKGNLEMTSTGAGMSYASVSGDFAQMSFSVARSAQVPERDNFKVDQQHMILGFVQEHFEAWLEYALLSGAIDLPVSRYEEFCAAAKFHPKRWEYIQPVQDAQADIMQVEAKLKSRSEVLAESANGRNFEDVIAELASENEIAEEHGIDLAPDATMPTIKKGEPGEEQPDDEEDEPMKKGKPSNNGHSKLLLNGHHR